MDGDNKNVTEEDSFARTEGAKFNSALKFRFDEDAKHVDQSISDMMTRHDEMQYLDQLRYIFQHGVRKDDRTGVGTISAFGLQSRYSLRAGVFPLLTTKKVHWKAVVEELLWFVRGCTDAKVLSEKNVRIWDKNGSRQYLDSIGLTKNEEGDLGPVYGFQWRHFGAEYVDCHSDYNGKGVDQLRQVVEMIKRSDARRLVFCAWNPVDLPKMALPPCHVLVQFYVINGELSCQMYQRSGDMGLGVPFNIASYSLLTCMIAHLTNLKPGEFIHTLGDAHIYLNHADALKQQVLRTPKPFPHLKIQRTVDNIDDFQYDDFVLTGYDPHPTISMTMAV